MKSYLIKLAKKSMALCLTVLMLMSCWVWVAPEKAEAATTEQEAGYYYVEIWGKVTDTCSAGIGTNDWRISYKENNGTGTEHIEDRKQLTSSGIDGKTVSSSEVLFASGWVPGWPTGVYFSVASSGSGCNQDEFTLQSMVAKVRNSAGQMVQLSNVFETGNATSHSTNTTDIKAAAPAPASAVDMTETKLTCPAWGTTTTNKTTAVMPATFYDQYGTKWLNAIDSSVITSASYHISNSAGGDDNGGTEEKGFWATTDGLKGYVNITAAMQENFTTSTETKDYYLVGNYTTSAGTFKASQKITVSYSKVTFTFNADGSISGLNSTIKNKSGSTLGTGTYSTSKYYGQAGDFPTKDSVTASDAYTFYGLWTKKQPTSGNASYNEKEADFAIPVSKADFVGYGGTEDGEYVTKDGVTYYNAGEQWDGSVSTFDGNRTYYGWWLSKDLTVKFYDIDGTFLGTKAVKYGQTQADIEWPTPTESYESGAYRYSNFTGTWENTDGTEINQSACTFTKDLILTPKYDTVNFTDKYTVNFINESDGSNLSESAEYAYRTNLADEGKIPADRTVPSGIKNDLQYSYTFEGWSVQKPASGNYHILLEDGDFNADGTAIAINSDWVVRSNVTYYPVYRRHLRTYAVNFWYKDSTGAEVSTKVTLKYGETLTPPTDNVPYTYAQEGYGYTFKEWTYTNASSATATFGYGNSIVFTKENIQFGLGAVEDGDNVTPVEINATYGTPVATPYTVTFNSRNDKGEVQTQTFEVKHGEYITDEIVGALAPTEKYDDGEALVHYTGSWKVTDGAAEQDEYTTDNLTAFSPTSHITFEAVYGNPQPFYTVTYVDGAETFGDRVLVGSNLPVWTIKQTNDNGTPDNAEDDFEEDVEYLPEMADTAQGYYTFQGWYDEKQTDTTYAETNGTKYEATSTVTSNLTLYPQFKFSPFTYTIKFMDYEGKVQLAAGKFEYGQSIEMITAEANRAAQAREADNTYTYSFIGWDKTVPTFCEGKDMTFVALYKPVYKYYNAKWYNSVLDGENWVADKSTTTEDGETVETALLATTKHTYDSKLNSPSVAVTCKVTPPDGQNYVFAGWYYNDADGNAQPYVRGMHITADMEFYATYKLSLKTYTVTTDVKGEAAEYTVADGDKATAIPDLAAGYVNADKHDEFAGWYTTSTFDEGTEFDITNTEITADITIYASFTESGHDYVNEELVTAPTYYEKGEKNVWCSCDAKLTEKSVEIDMLTDTVKPTGTIYLGTQGSWSSTGTPAYETDNDPVSLYANADTDVIITTNDKGDVNALYNPSGIGKGIKNIKAFAFPGETALTGENYGAALQIAQTVYGDDTTETLNNTANYVIELGDVYVADLAADGSVQYNEDGSVKHKNLENGETYIIYYYVTDKAGNQLNRLVRTAKFIYDNTAPVFTVEGENNADKVSSTPTYCETATITGIEEGATLTVNGVAVDDVTETGTYEITAAGNYLVTVTDKAGNKTSKKFQLNDEHSYDVKEVHSTCTTDGYKTEICIVCDAEKDKVEYKATGHDWTVSPVPSTCTENGYNYKLCSACGAEEKVYEVDGELIDPAHGHIYDMDDEDNIIYTVITEATCKTAGKEIATCEACGETVSREIPVDANAHNWGSVKTIKATCTQAGYTYKTCKLCYTQTKVADIAATGHVETQWVETQAATCGEAGIETLQCKKCKAYVDSDDEDTAIDTREIAATGRHILKVSEDPAKTFEATADKEGQITRYCTQCGHEWTETVAKIEKFTVKFVDEDGSEIKTITEVVKGTTIEKSAVTEPTKANSADGKYKYTFAGWKDASGNAVTLPIDVAADITLTATYAQSTIIYTHQFMVPNTWVSPLSGDNYELYATMMGAMGDSRVPVAKPVFSLADEDADAELKKLYTFTFLGWSTTGAKGDIITDFTIAGDATFYAVFEANAIAYQVIYYNGTQYVWDTTVDGGDSVTFGGTTPTKAYDNDNHYTFDKWYTDATLKTEYKGEAITATTRLYAGFTATAHSYDMADGKGEVTQAATCVLPEITAYECLDENCDYKYKKQTSDALGHNLGDYVYDEETGKNVASCSRCDYTHSVDASCTVKFVNTNGLTLATYTVKAGGEVTYDFEKYGTPTQAATAEKTYTFAGWEDANGQYIPEYKFLNITEDATYTAYYTDETRTYVVSYVDVNNKILQTAEVEYGEKVPAYTGTEPTKKYDDFNHYTFKEWSVAAGSTVTGETLIKPVFNAIAHNYDKEEIKDATCTEPGGKHKICSACGHSYASTEIVPVIPHTWVEIDRVEPDHNTATDGKIVYKCSVCEETKEEVLAAESIKITLNVVDSNGAAIEGATVRLYDSAQMPVREAVTDASGVVTFVVPKGTYTYSVVYDGKEVVSNQPAKEGTSSTPGIHTVPDCTCSCHRNNFWGTIFRFFHKIIKLFTGKIGCCSCPDPRY